MNDYDKTQNKLNLEITPLSEYIKQLPKIIKSSKEFIRSIIEHIRHQGKIKLIKNSQKNSTHLQYKNMFPTFVTAESPLLKDQEEHYPADQVNAKFDLESRKKILNIDHNFKNRMNTNIQKSYYNDFINKDEWIVSDQLKSLNNIQFTIQKFQEKYEYLKSSNKLEESFMIESNPFLFMINDYIIPVNTHQIMMQDFKNLVPNVETQRLISTYANKKFLHQAYLQFLSEHPEINQYQFNNSKNTYQIKYLSDGSIKLIATQTSDLNVKKNNSIGRYKSCGIRATIILSPNHTPIMKYSHFLK